MEKELPQASFLSFLPQGMGSRGQQEGSRSERRWGGRAETVPLPQLCTHARTRMYTRARTPPSQLVPCERTELGDGIRQVLSVTLDFMWEPDISTAEPMGFLTSSGGYAFCDLKEFRRASRLGYVFVWEQAWGEPVPIKLFRGYLSPTSTPAPLSPAWWT